jgi:hypothetical protein
LPFGIQFAALFAVRSAFPYSATTPLQLGADPFPDRPEPRNARRGDELRRSSLTPPNVVHAPRVWRTAVAAVCARRPLLTPL